MACANSSLILCNHTQLEVNEGIVKKGWLLNTLSCLDECPIQDYGLEGRGGGIATILFYGLKGVLQN